MVFTDAGKTEIRNWLAGTSATAPSKMLWGTTSETSSETDTQMTGIIHADSFVDVGTSVTRQVEYEGMILSTEATGSSIRQIGIGTETTGTAGTIYIKEDISPITKTDQFDLQTFIIAEVE